MTNTNKHLVRVGHELAATMTADTPIIEIAKMVTRLATALDVQTALVAQLTGQRDAVAAEAAVMLRLIIDISENHVEYLSEGEDCMMAGVPLDYVSEINMYVSRDVNAENPFPAIDSICDSLRAEGVEMFAAEMSDQHQKLQSGGYFDSQVVIYAKLSELASSFARQLRESKGAQS